MDDQALKQWIRENVEVTVQTDWNDASSNSVYVGLRFVGEAEPFTRERVHIPEEPR